MRCDANDYSVHPGVIGRRVELAADLDRVRVLCDGRLVADHHRAWARHQSITDPEHAAAAATLRHAVTRTSRTSWQVADIEVQHRPLSDYDTALGLDGGAA